MIEVSGVTAIYAMYTGFSQKFMMIGKSIPELVSSLVSGRIIYDFLQEKEAIEKENKSYLVDRKREHHIFRWNIFISTMVKKKC